MSVSLYRAYLRQFNAKKFFNIILCRLSYWLSRCGLIWFKHSPCFVSIEPANFCNLRCPQCPTGIGHNKSKKMLTIEEFSTILSFLPDTIHTIQFYFQGEPLLNPQLADMVAIAHKKNIVCIISTNAQLLTEETARKLISSGLDKIIISLDGLRQETYSQYRKGGRVDKAVYAIQYLSKQKRLLQANIEIELQCLRLKSNENEWQLLSRNYKQLGADSLRFKTAQFYDFENGNELMPSNERFSRYKRLPNGTYKRKKPYYNHCYRLWSGCVIDSHLNIIPCCFDKDSAYSIGNLSTQSFNEIWYGAKAMSFRKKILSNRKQIPICLNCNE